jgi:quercetin dioxygenase-like cupin family protein
MIRLTVFAALLALCVTGSASAQQASWPPNTPIKRTVLQKFDVADSKSETIVGLAEVAPNVNIGRHTHFGVEAGYVIEGEVTLLVAGQPDKPLKPGDSYQIAPGAPHDARSGDKGAKIIATHVVEKGKPLSTPAP